MKCLANNSSFDHAHFKIVKIFLNVRPWVVVVLVPGRYVTYVQFRIISGRLKSPMIAPEEAYIEAPARNMISVCLRYTREI